MAYLLFIALFLALTVIGTLVRSRYESESFEQAAQAVFPSSLGFAAAIANAVVGSVFVFNMAQDELVRGLFRPYMLPGSSVDNLLTAIVTGALVLFLIATGRYRAAIRPPKSLPRRRR